MVCESEILVAFCMRCYVVAYLTGQTNKQRSMDKVVYAHIGHSPESFAVPLSPEEPVQVLLVHFLATDVYVQI